MESKCVFLRCFEFQVYEKKHKHALIIFFFILPFFYTSFLFLFSSFLSHDYIFLLLPLHQRPNLRSSVSMVWKLFSTRSDKFVSEQLKGLHTFTRIINSTTHNPLFLLVSIVSECQIIARLLSISYVLHKVNVNIVIPVYIFGTTVSRVCIRTICFWIDVTYSAISLYMPAAVSLISSVIRSKYFIFILIITVLMARGDKTVI